MSDDFRKGSVLPAAVRLAAVTAGAGFAIGHSSRYAVCSSAMYIGSLTRGGHVSEMVVLMQRSLVPL